MRSYRRYIHSSRGIYEDENIVEIVFHYRLGSNESLVASRLLEYRNNLDDSKQLSPDQFEEYGNFIDHIDDLIHKYQFEVDNPNDIHQSTESYSYYFRFTAIDKHGNYMDEHRIVLRVSDHPQGNQSYEPLKYQAESAWGKNRKTLCDNIVIYPGNGKSARFNTVHDAYRYIDKLFDDLYEGKYYGMVRFPKGNARIPQPFNQYFDIIIPSEYNTNLKYTYENASNYVDLSTMDPLAWAKPSEDAPSSIKAIGNILIVKELDSSRLLAIAFEDDKPYILSSRRFQQLMNS